jgi:hypothetical protein
MPLLDLPAFASAAPGLREAALKLRTCVSSITIVAPLDAVGVLTCAVLEAALLDAGIPYQRRLRDVPQAPKGPCIRVSTDAVSVMAPVGSDPLHIGLAPLEVDALIASGGDARRGVISTVALAAALGESIAPDGAMSRLLRPWALSGNWLSEGLAHTYDPVYTVLRNHLSELGSIRVVPLPEVPDIVAESLPGIDPVAMEAIRDRWGRLDLEGRAQALSHLLKPLLEADLPSTARFEELGWHRILSVGWERDLASQLTDFTETWRNDPGGRRRSSGEAIDALLRTGRLS